MQEFRDEPSCAVERAYATDIDMTFTVAQVFGRTEIDLTVPAGDPAVGYVVANLYCGLARHLRVI